MSALPSSSGSPSIQVFYDGGCKVCAWEVRKYLEMDVHSRIGTIDINRPEFKAENYGLDALSVRKYFHVLTSDQRVVAGVPAFIAIWEVLDTPWSRRAAKVSKLFPVRWLLNAGYAGFVRVRPFLPRNSIVECDDNSCSIK